MVLWMLKKNTHDLYQVVWRKNHPTPVTFDPKDSEGNKKHEDGKMVKHREENQEMT